MVFAVLAGAQLAGFMGMLIALPVAAVIVVLLRHFRVIFTKKVICMGSLWWCCEDECRVTLEFEI